MTILLSLSYVVYKFKEATDINPDELIVFIIATLLIFGIYWISVKLTSGIAEITLSKEHLEFEWLNKPILKSQDNHKIDLYEIDSWSFSIEYHYNSLDINCHSSSISISRFPEWGHNKDDFQSFISSFSHKIESINKKKLERNKRNDRSDQKVDNEKLIRDQ
jgi:hypothetical protein